MRQTWRWFGPKDLVSVDDMLQAGVEGVVSALHHIPSGALWSPAEIDKRKAEIGMRRDGTPSGLAWDVVDAHQVLWAEPSPGLFHAASSLITAFCGLASSYHRAILLTSMEVWC